MLVRPRRQVSPWPVRAVRVLQAEEEVVVGIVSDSVPERYKALYDRAMSGSSRELAMWVQCQHCMGWEPTDCTEPDCPIYKWRPKSCGGTAPDHRGPLSSENIVSEAQKAARERFAAQSAMRRGKTRI